MKRERQHGDNFVARAEDVGSAINPWTTKPYSRRYFELLERRKMLPIFDKDNLIVDTVRRHSVTLLMGETGSGKTTQIPQFLLATAGKGMIACTQPRRVAAMSVASRVAEEMDVRLGDTVGYHVRFENAQNEKTRILYLTDGMLLREAQADNKLSRYSVIVVDEAHERTVDTDILLGILRILCTHRPDLRVMVMSATLDMERFQGYFSDAPLIRIPGRMHSVRIFYTETPVKDYVQSALEHATHIHVNEPMGDILIFLIGEAEIERAVHRLRHAIDDATSRGGHHTAPNAVVVPLYGSMPLKDQQRAFQPAGANVRKIICSTNIAETSVTIDGVVYVVDCGYHKQSLYNAEARVDCLLPTVISKASAEQRAGRAGRTKPGKCYRLMTEADYQSQLPDQSYPEIMRSSMIATLLTLLRFGVRNPAQFPFIDPPSAPSFTDAYLQLSFLGAVDEAGELTPLGLAMADFPIQPHLARMLLKSADFRCSADVAIVVAMVEVPNVFVRPPRRQGEADQMREKFAHRDGDHLTLLNVFHAFLREHKSGIFCEHHFLKYQSLAMADRVYTQLIRALERHSVPILSQYNAEERTINSVVIRRAMLEGMFCQVAFLPHLADRYHTVRDQQLAMLHQTSSLTHIRPTWIFYHRLELHTQEGCFVRLATAVDPQWLLDVSPDYFSPDEIDDCDIRREIKKLWAERSAIQNGASLTA